QIKVICLCADPRQYGVAGAPAGHEGEDVLLIVPPEDEAKVLEKFARFFEAIEPLPPVEIEQGASLSLILGHHLQGILPGDP
ncbi:MAG TPA: hypothetical protein VKT70_12910, partial [Stellaceae bacterium]|nr:hypothetical protein [Stellaceae bacterium]